MANGSAYRLVGRARRMGEAAAAETEPRPTASVRDGERPHVRGDKWGAIFQVARTLEPDQWAVVDGSSDWPRAKAKRCRAALKARIRHAGLARALSVHIVEADAHVPSGSVVIFAHGSAGAARG